MKIIPGSRIRYYVARFSIFLVTVALIGGMVGCGSTAIKIGDWYDLDAVRNNLSGRYILVNDLDFNIPGYDELAGVTANQGRGWHPIGTIAKPFAGTFDGQGYEIRDLFINRPDEYSVGLFGFIDEEGTIKDTAVVNVAVTGREYVGSLVGRKGGGIVSNSYATGSVTGNQSLGGLVGTNAGTVSDSYSSATVTGYAGIGGLIGQNAGTVSNSYSTGSVTGDDSIGGLVGACYGTVSNSYSSGDVTGEVEIGGLVGWNEGGIVSNSYATGNVTGYARVGGLVGWNEGGTVSNSYATGNVTGYWYSIGGLVGSNYLLGNNGTVSNSFWDIETSGQAASAGGISKNTTEMQDIATFSGAGWSIIAVIPGSTNTTYTWNIVHNVTYPFLSWQS
jgi:hypothetical protein